MKKNILPLLFYLVSLSLSAQESSSYAMTFLRLPSSIRALALGGENISIVTTDPSLSIRNPALLSSLDDKTLGLSFQRRGTGVSTMSANFNVNLSDRLTIGAYGLLADYGQIDEIDAAGTTLGSFHPRDITLGLSTSYLVFDRWAAGVSLKIISSSIGQYHSMAAAVDLGVSYDDPDRGWSAALTANHLGGQLSAYADEYDRLPVDVVAGVSKRLLHTPLRLSLTLVNLNDWDRSLMSHVIVGGELLLSDQVWIGGGYRPQTSTDMALGEATERSSSGAGFSLGGGISLKRFGLTLAWAKVHPAFSTFGAHLSYAF